MIKQLTERLSINKFTLFSFLPKIAHHNQHSIITSGINQPSQTNQPHKPNGFLSNKFKFTSTYDRNLQCGRLFLFIQTRLKNPP
jgi:hypothetical protein